MGFSVTGRVLNSQEGEGVPDATVTLNNQMKGKADGRGEGLSAIGLFWMFASHVLAAICIAQRMR